MMNKMRKLEHIKDSGFETMRFNHKDNLFSTMVSDFKNDSITLMETEEFFSKYEDEISVLNDIALSQGFDSAYKQALFIITEKIPNTELEVRNECAVEAMKAAVKYNSTIEYAIDYGL